MKKVFVTGSNGLVGSRFVELSSNNFKLLTPEIDQLNLLDKKSVSYFIKKEKPDVIVHFAAFTDVTAAESQRGDKKGLCWMVNVEGTRNLINSIDHSRTHFIHISTDMVFPGSKDDPGPYEIDHKPESDPEKLTWYGFTKAEAERLVLNKFKDKATIVRIIYPVRAKYEAKLDYLRKPLRLFDEGKLYPLFSDQQISVTFIDELCKTLNKIIDKNIDGVLHISSQDTTTPFEIFSYLLKLNRAVKNDVKSIKLNEFLKNTKQSQIRYPKYGGLKTIETSKKLNHDFLTWKQIVDKISSQDIKV